MITNSKYTKISVENIKIGMMYETINQKDELEAIRSVILNLKKNPNYYTTLNENAEIAQSDVTKIIDYSEKLQSMFTVNDDLEDWVKAKLNHACDYVATVRDYLKFYQEEKDKTNIQEKWSKKYKNSIDCSSPKGFSQRAHCLGRKKRQAGGKTSSKSVKECYKEAILEIVREQNSSMAIGALKQLNSDAKELESMLQPNTQLEDWVKAKLNLAGEYLDDVYHHLDHFGPKGRKLDDLKEGYYDEQEAERLKRSLRFGMSSQREKKYWFTPDGTVVEVGISHEDWILKNDKSVQKGPTLIDTYENAVKKGYIRAVLDINSNIFMLSNLRNYDFSMEGNQSQGIPPVKPVIQDSIKNFIKEKNIQIVSTGRGNIIPDLSKLDESQITEGWKDTLKSLGLAAALATTGSDSAIAAGSKGKSSKAKVTNVSKQKQQSVQKKAPGAKIFVNTSELEKSLTSSELYVLRHEGAVRNLYYIAGKPHIGVGHYLDGSTTSRNSIKKIIGLNRDKNNSKELSLSDKQLQNYVDGQKATTELLSDVVLTNEQISKLFREDFLKRVEIAERRHPKFRSLPASVQIMIMDSIFRGEQHPKTDQLINSDNPDWNKVADMYLKDAEYAKGGGVAKRMDDNAALLRKAATEISMTSSRKNESIS